MRRRIACGASTLVRAAASSIANGKPSNRLQISAMAIAFSGVIAKPGWIARARSINSATAGTATISAGGGNRPRAGSASGETGNSRSPRMRRGARLVASIVSAGQWLSRSARAGTASRRCSQLSRMRRSRRPCRSARSRSATGCSAVSPTPSVSAIVGSKRPGSSSDASGTYARPSGNIAHDAAARWSASVVFPTPPGPVRVTSRTESVLSSVRSSPTAVSRPINGCGNCGSGGKRRRCCTFPVAGDTPQRATLSKRVRSSVPSPKASTKRRTVSLYGLRPSCSRYLMPRTLNCARSASSSWVSPATARCCLSR